MANPFTQQYVVGDGQAVPGLSAPSDDPFLSVTDIQDPEQIAFHARKVGEQITAGARANGFPLAGDVDLTPMIADIVVQTTIQGASVLEVHLSDPAWLLLQRQGGDGPCFVDVAEDGWLLPIDVNFPYGVTGCWWRLCACELTLDLGGPNVTLTLEARAATRMRELSGPVQSFQGELLSTFVERRVRDANGDDDLLGPGRNHIVFVNLVTPPPPTAINDGSPVFSPKPNRHSAGGASSASQVRAGIQSVNSAVLDGVLQITRVPAPPPADPASVQFGLSQGSQGRVLP